MDLRRILSQTDPSQSDEVPGQVIILKYKDRIRRCTQQAKINRVNFPKYQIPENLRESISQKVIIMEYSIYRKIRFSEN